MNIVNGVVFVWDEDGGKSVVIWVISVLLGFDFIYLYKDCNML